MSENAEAEAAVAAAIVDTCVLALFQDRGGGKPTIADFRFFEDASDDAPAPVEASAL